MESSLNVIEDKEALYDQYVKSINNNGKMKYTLKNWNRMIGIGSVPLERRPLLSYKDFCEFIENSSNKEKVIELIA